MKAQILIAPLLGLGGLALGVILGRGPLAESTEGNASGDILMTPGGSLLDSSGASNGSNGTSGATGRSGAVDVAGASPAADALLGVINNPNGQAAVNRFYTMLGKMPSKDIAQLVVDIDNYPNHSRRRESRELIIDYLTMTDPMKALEVRKDLPDRGILGKAFKQLGRMNPDEAVRALDSLETPGDRSSALRSIFVGASEIDPAGAFALLKRTDEANPQLYHEVFDNWAEMDPTTAARTALTVTKPAERREALKIIAKEWAERDPKALFDWISNDGLNTLERETMRNEAMGAYANRDAKAAMEMLEGMDAGVRNRALPSVVRELVEQDPQAAADWLRTAPDSFAKYKAIEENSWRFANEAPGLAIDLAQEIPEMRERTLSSAFSTLAQQDFDSAMAKADDWKDSPDYQNIMQSIASGYSSKNPEEALEWANTLDDADIRNSAISNAISRLSGEDPNLALKELDGLGLSTDDTTYQNSIRNVASSWARIDPVSASEWIDTLPDENLQSNAIQSVADRWARIDPVSASEWIGGLNEGPARDQAASTLVRRIQRDDPESAAIWAGSIGDESIRNNTLNSVFSNWMQRDPDGAMSAIEGSSLPEGMKNNFRQQANPDLRIETPSISIPADVGTIRNLQFGG